MVAGETVYGYNIMGRLLMSIRDVLLDDMREGRATPASSDEPRGIVLSTTGFSGPDSGSESDSGPGPSAPIQRYPPGPRLGQRTWQEKMEQDGEGSPSDSDDGQSPSLSDSDSDNGD